MDIEIKKDHLYKGNITGMLIRATTDSDKNGWFYGIVEDSGFSWHEKGTELKFINAENFKLVKERMPIPTLFQIMTEYLPKGWSIQIVGAIDQITTRKFKSSVYVYDRFGLMFKTFKIGENTKEVSVCVQLLKIIGERDEKAHNLWLHIVNNYKKEEL